MRLAPFDSRSSFESKISCLWRGAQENRGGLGDLGRAACSALPAALNRQTVLDVSFCLRRADELDGKGFVRVDGRQDAFGGLPNDEGGAPEVEVQRREAMSDNRDRQAVATIFDGLYDSSFGDRSQCALVETIRFAEGRPPGCSSDDVLRPVESKRAH